MSSTSAKQFDTTNVDDLIKSCFPYDEFHDGQFEAIKFAIESFVSGKTHVIIEAPTGVGKSVIAVTVHRVLARLALAKSQVWRSTITTTTKGLQDQYTRDGMIDADLRSKTNYKCPYGTTYGTAECRVNCKNKMCKPSSECEYLITKKQWMQSAKIRTTNNAMLLEMPTEMCASDEARSDLIILDECHKLDEGVLNHSMLKFRPASWTPLIKAKVPHAELIQELLGKILIFFIRMREGEIYTVNQDFLNIVYEIAENMTVATETVEKWIESYVDKLDLSAADNLMQMASVLYSTSSMIELLATNKLTDVIIYSMKDQELVLKPIFPSDVADYSLFNKADCFLHMSATICGMDAYYKRLGISADKVAMFNINNPIPVDSRIVKYFPVGRMSGGADDAKGKLLAEAIDGIFEHCHGANENALVHTVSYTMADMIAKYSKYKDRMVIARGADRAKTMELLEKAAERKFGVIILSAAMEEGVDLKHDLCRMNVIAKVPYEFMGDPLVKMTSNREPDQYFRQAILRIVQASGRGSRGVNDYSTTYILDESFGSLVSRNEKFFPEWYLDSIRDFQ